MKSYRRRNALIASLVVIISLSFFLTPSAFSGEGGLENPEQLSLAEGSLINEDYPLISELSTGNSTFVDAMPGKVYRISDEYDLKMLSDYTKLGYNTYGVTFFLSEDIDLSNICGPGKNGGISWIPIGNRDVPFMGLFDGNGYSIYDLYIYSAKSMQGLFGCIDGASILNVNLKNSYVYAYDQVGSVVGYNLNGYIYCCSNDGLIQGYSVHNDVKIGGICGWNTMMIDGCYNTGRVDCMATGMNVYVGGICGYNQSGVIQGCINDSNITAGEGSESDYTSFAGGIAGYNRGCAHMNINNGFVSGNVSAGGIAAINVNPDILGCYNSGEIKGGKYAGGIVGINYYGSNILGVDGGFASGAVSDESAEVNYCYNLGSVTGDLCAGGIVGYNHSSTIMNCFSMACEVSSGDYAGRIVGNDILGNIFNNYAWNESTISSPKQNDQTNVIDWYVGDNLPHGVFPSKYWDISVWPDTLPIPLGIEMVQLEITQSPVLPLSSNSLILEVYVNDILCNINHTNITVTMPARSQLPSRSNIEIISNAGYSWHGLTSTDGGNTWTFTAVGGGMELEYTIKIAYTRESKTNTSPQVYTISTAATEGGVISPMGEISAFEGRSKIFVIIPDNGYVFSKLIVDGNNLALTDNVYILFDVKENHTITAVFEENTYVAPIADNSVVALDFIYIAIVITLLIAVILIICLIRVNKK